MSDESTDPQIKPPEVDPPADNRKAQAIAMILGGASRREVAAKLRVSRNRVRAWCEEPDVAALLKVGRAAHREAVAAPGSGSEPGGSAPTDPLAIARAAAAHPDATPATRLTAARVIADLEERRRETSTDLSEVQPADLAALPTADAFDLGVRCYERSIADLTDDQLLARHASPCFGDDLDPDEASGFMDRLEHDRLPPEVVEKLLDLPLGQSLDLIRDYVDQVARSCRLPTRPPARPPGDA